MVRATITVVLAVVLTAGATASVLGAAWGFGLLLSTPAAPFFAMCPPVAAALAFWALLKLAPAEPEREA